MTAWHRSPWSPSPCRRLIRQHGRRRQGPPLPSPSPSLLRPPLPGPLLYRSPSVLPVLSRAATPSTLLLGRVQSRSTRYPTVRAPLTESSQRARARGCTITRMHHHTDIRAVSARLEIESESECSQAIAALGITNGGDSWTGSRTTIPKGCSLQTATDTMVFNTGEGGLGRLDLAPVCKFTGNPEPTAP